MSDTDYDLIVVGAGGAGLAAAVSAAEAGCTVLVLEAESKPGGSTGHSQGVFSAAGTSLQKALGFEDSVQALYEHYMTLNGAHPPAGLIHAFCSNAAPTLEWLIGLGVEFPQRLVEKPPGAIYPTAVDSAGLYASGLEWPPRGHCPAGGGQSYIDVLENRRFALGVDLLLRTRVQRLSVSGRTVVGIEVDGEQIRSRAVALTCGGFGHDRELLRCYFPDAYRSVPEGDHPSTVTAAGNRGDGIRLGLQAGAAITGTNCGLLTSRAYIRRRPVRAFPGYQPTASIYVNARGNRFATETAPYAVMPGLIKSQGFCVWGIFDEAARLRSDPTLGGFRRGWAPDFILECVESGDFATASTLSELAGECGIAADGLETAVAQYNEDLHNGVDRAFLRDLRGLHPISTPPFYAYEYRTCEVVVTGAGPRIDSSAHVLDHAARVIPGLYAAGECGAGVLGRRYVGGGNSVANALTMGRVAGQTIGRELRARRS